MVELLATSGAGVEVVVGLGGSGKTFSLQAAHELWHSCGIPVAGCAIARQAANVLAQTTGIPATTIAALTKQLDAGRSLVSGGVLVVDEAGMVPTRDLARILTAAQRSQTKVVLVGDHRQLPEIEAGGSFAALVHRFEPARLVGNRRQRERWERDALRELRSGDPQKAIAAYLRHDRIVTDVEPGVLRERMVSDWAAALETDPDATMIAFTREDVRQLNRLARNRLIDAGRLPERGVSVGMLELAPGERVVCTRNDASAGLINGMVATVTVADRDRVVIETAAGPVTVPKEYLLRGHLQHAYAITGHKAQGQTLDNAFVLCHEGAYREWLYVAASRGRERTTLYASLPDSGARERSPARALALAAIGLGRAASRSRAQAVASEGTRVRERARERPPSPGLGRER
jgi:ATP-dependent exoDNAse (exonuclease V) alpha subunit